MQTYLLYIRQKMDELYNVIAAGQTGEVNETSVPDDQSG